MRAETGQLLSDKLFLSIDLKACLLIEHRRTNQAKILNDTVYNFIQHLPKTPHKPQVHRLTHFLRRQPFLRLWRFEGPLNAIVDLL